MATVVSNAVFELGDGDEKAGIGFERTRFGRSPQRTSTAKSDLLVS